MTAKHCTQRSHSLEEDPCLSSWDLCPLLQFCRRGNWFNQQVPREDPKSLVKILSIRFLLHSPHVFLTVSLSVPRGALSSAPECGFPGQIQISSTTGQTITSVLNPNFSPGPGCGLVVDTLAALTRFRVKLGHLGGRHTFVSAVVLAGSQRTGRATSRSMLSNRNLQ